MAAQATEQLNKTLTEATEFRLCSLSFYGKTQNGSFSPFTLPNGNALPRSYTEVLSLIWTCNKNFATGNNKPKLRKCVIARKCGLTKSTVNRVIKSLIELKLIEETEKDVYKIIPKVDGEHYIVLDNYLRHKKFNLNETFKRLPPSASHVFAKIKAFYLEKDEEGNYKNYDFRDRKPINYFTSSDAGLAGQLNLPQSTVADAIPLLIKADLVHRNKRIKFYDENGNAQYYIVQERDVPGNTLSWFTIPYEVLTVERRSTRTASEVQFNENLEELEISEDVIEQTYTELREQAEEKYKTIKTIIESDEELQAAKKELIATTEREFTAHTKQSTSSMFFDKLTTAQRRYYGRLAALGLSEDDFEPPYNCKLCNDTGQNLNTGQRCTCRPSIKRIILNRIFKA